MLLPSETIAYTYSKAAAAAIIGDPCAGAANPVSAVTINDAALEPDRDLPHHDEQLPRRRRQHMPVAAAGDEPHDGAGGPVRHQLARGLPRGGVTDRGATAGSDQHDAVAIGPLGAAVALRHRRPARTIGGE